MLRLDGSLLPSCAIEHDSAFLEPAAQSTNRNRSLRHIPQDTSGLDGNAARPVLRYHR
jgi:hypothetical protein